MLLFALGAATSFLFDHYISPPLTGIDLLAGILAIPAFAAGTFAAGWITYLLGGI